MHLGMSSTWLYERGRYYSATVFLLFSKMSSTLLFPHSTCLSICLLIYSFLLIFTECHHFWRTDCLSTQRSSIHLRNLSVCLFPSLSFQLPIHLSSCLHAYYILICIHFHKGCQYFLHTLTLSILTFMKYFWRVVRLCPCFYSSVFLSNPSIHPSRCLSIYCLLIFCTFSLWVPIFLDCHTPTQTPPLPCIFIKGGNISGSLSVCPCTF